MSPAYHSITVLSRALDQTGDVLEGIHRDQLSDPTPCTDWTVAQLIGHVVGTPRRFLEMMNGEQPDWSKAPEPATEGWTAEFRTAADDLIHAWHEIGDEADAGSVDWQTAELAVHTWSPWPGRPGRRGPSTRRLPSGATPSCLPRSRRRTAGTRSGRRSRRRTTPTPTTGWRHSPAASPPVPDDTPPKATCPSRPPAPTRPGG
jgi:hypothetical protein